MSEKWIFSVCSKLVESSKGIKLFSDKAIETDTAYTIFFLYGEDYKKIMSINLPKDSGHRLAATKLNVAFNYMDKYNQSLVNA